MISALIKKMPLHHFTWAVVIILLSGCGTTQKMSEAQLETLGIRTGAEYWVATSQLYQKGYNCSVSGAKREHFDCTKTAGFIPTCILRIELTVDDQNKISSFRAPDPACIGTP